MKENIIGEEVIMMIPKTFVPPNDIKWRVVYGMILGVILCVCMQLYGQFPSTDFRPQVSAELW